MSDGIGQPVDWNAPLDEPWHSPQSIPPGANTPSRRLTPAAMGLPSMGSPRTDPGLAVREAHRYARIQEGNIAPGVAGDANTLVPFLTEPSTLRNLLGLRNGSATANIVIGFGAVANNFSWLRLTPGQIIFFDTVVPQNDLYATADAAGALLTWAVGTIPGSLST